MNKLAWVLLALIGTVVVVGSWFLLKMPEREVDGGDVGTPISNPEAATGKQVYHLDVDGARREFIVYRPDNVPTTEELPVVFMFHGGGQNGEIFYRGSGWTNKADEEGLMVVFPTALKYHVYSDSKVKNGEVMNNVAEYATRWSGAKIETRFDPEYPDQTTHDDFAFVDAMVNFLGENYAVDTNRFYATGFSNGGGFVNNLMVRSTDTFAAFASNASGGFSVGELYTEDGGKPGDFVARPSIVLIGSLDPKLTYMSGVILGEEISEFATDESAADEDNAVRVRYIDPYLDILGLTDSYTYEHQGRISHFTFADSASSSSAAELNLYVVEGMQHIYPNGNNFPFDVADLYWDFFEQYSL